MVNKTVGEGGADASSPPGEVSVPASRLVLIPLTLFGDRTHRLTPSATSGDAARCGSAAAMGLAYYMAHLITRWPLRGVYCGIAKPE
ncbi:hypothetical protein JYU34_000813 [Plutella xylostella]|uniref:Uncharacterized protein n=1 Tax=Plutella xylostella TaxID=51655 RepID=A0ABQ7R8L0_PLUXY|nr:hypothetical protein JYU34_000813 [Plutella xylostella]